MRGLIGHPLGHSYSPYIHKILNNEKDYKLYDINEYELEFILKTKKFDCFNVTIPYKEKCIKYLDELTDTARKLQSVNCIKNNNGMLIGHNTDYDGFKYLLENNNINLKNKNVLILGSGGSCKTIKCVLEEVEVKKIYIASRKSDENYVGYDEIYNLEIDCIVNTTPIGMYPNINECIIDLTKFNNIEYVIDIIYNPINTKLVSYAKLLGIKSFSGLDMLVAQAYYAVEFFDGIKIDKSLIKDIINNLKKSKQNIVFIGMPSSGKTTISKILSKILDYKIIDLDEMFIERYKTNISDFFNKNGEEEFRRIESLLVDEIQSYQKCIISTGGGVIKNIDNIINLKKNGILIMLDRNLENLEISNDRPLGNDFNKLKKIYYERIELYRKYSDYIVENNSSIEECINKIKEIL